MLNLPIIQNMTSQLNWSTGSKDLILLLAVALIVLIHLLAFRQDKYFALLFSIYASYLVILFFPYQLWLSQLSLESLTWLKTGGFMGLTLVFAIIFSRAHIFASPFTGLLGRMFKAIIFGFINAGLLLSLLATLLPFAYISQFSPFFQKIFITDLARFIWLAIPLLIVLLSVKLKKRGPGRPSLG